MLVFFNDLDFKKISIWYLHGSENSTIVYILNAEYFDI